MIVMLTLFSMYTILAKHATMVMHRQIQNVMNFITFLVHSNSTLTGITINFH